MSGVARDDRRSPCEWAEMMAHDLAEDALEIADAPVPLVGGRMGPGAVEAKRLQVELCKWLASQLYPEIYGNKVAQEVSYPDGASPAA